MIKSKYIIPIGFILALLYFYIPIRLEYLITIKLNDVPDSVEAQKAITEITKYGDLALPRLLYWMGKDLMITTNVMSCFKIITQEDSLSLKIEDKLGSVTLDSSPHESFQRQKAEEEMWRELIADRIESKG